MLAAFAGQDVINVVVLLFRRYRNNALMVGCTSQARKLLTRYGTQRNTGSTAKLGDLLNASIAAPRRNRHILKPTLARCQRVFYGMDTKNNHERNCCPAALVLQQSAARTSDAGDTDGPDARQSRFCNGKLEFFGTPDCLVFAAAAFRIPPGGNSRTFH